MKKFISKTNKKIKKIDKKIAILLFLILLVGLSYWISNRSYSDPGMNVKKNSFAQFQPEINKTNAKPDAILLFDKESMVVSRGEVFDLLAKVDPGSNITQGINAAQLDITFNPKAFEVSSATAISPFTELNSAKIDNEKGTISAVFFIGGSQVTQISDIAKLSFKTKNLSGNFSIAYSGTSQVVVMDGKGTKVLGSEKSTTVKIQ